MSSKMKRCAVCGGSRIRIARRRENYEWKGKYLVVIENVPMQVCEDCGESFIEAVVARQLDMIAQPIIFEYRRKRRIPRPLAVVDFHAMCDSKQEAVPLRG